MNIVKIMIPKISTVFLHENDTVRQGPERFRAHGYMKTTTIAVLFSSAISVFRKKEDTHFFGRRIDTETVRSAATIALMYITLFLTACASCLTL